jgi:putative transcriptional regulator
VHKTAQGLHDAGLIDAKTMRDFDASCLTTVQDLSAKQIAASENAQASVKTCLRAIST